METEDSEKERDTRPTMPPTVSELIQALAGTNELLLQTQSDLRFFMSELREFKRETRERLDALEIAAE